MLFVCLINDGLMWLHYLHAVHVCVYGESLHCLMSWINSTISSTLDSDLGDRDIKV